LTEAVRAARADASALVAVTGTGAVSQVRCIRRTDQSSEMLIVVDDGLRLQGVPHPALDWHDWAQKEVDEELAKIGLSRNRDSKNEIQPVETPYYDLRQLPGNSAFVRVGNRAYYLVVIRVYVRRGRLPDKHIQDAIDLYDRVRVGDVRLHSVIEANANSAPAAAQDFVLGTSEGKRQRLARVQNSQLKRQKLFLHLQRQTRALDTLTTLVANLETALTDMMQ
jgi:hypothetical protein